MVATSTLSVSLSNIDAEIFMVWINYLQGKLIRIILLGDCKDTRKTKIKIE